MVEFIYLCIYLILKYRMKKLTLLYILLLTIAMIGCTSVDDNAKKAAKYNKESIELTRANRLDDAKELYDKSQAIINEYKNTDQYQEFHNAYNTYLSTDNE